MSDLRTFRYVAFSRHPVAVRDITVELPADSGVEAATLTRAIREAAGVLLVDLDIVDAYRRPDDGRAITWRLTLQASDRSVTGEEANAAQERARHAAYRLIAEPVA